MIACSKLWLENSIRTAYQDVILIMRDTFSNWCKFLLYKLGVCFKNNLIFISDCKLQQQILFNLEFKFYV